MAKKSEVADAEEITLMIPVAEFPPGAYCSPRLDLTLSHQQAQTLKRIVAGLDRAGSRLENGSRVVSGADAIRFILEQE